MPQQASTLDGIKVAVILPDGLSKTPGEFLSRTIFKITDKHGSVYSVEYYQLKPQLLRQGTSSFHQAFNDKRVRDAFEKLVIAAASAFSNYTPEKIQNIIINKIDKMNKRKSFALAFDDKTGDIAALQIYQDGMVSGQLGPQRVLYLDQIGTARRYQGMGLGSTLANKVFTEIKPTVICTSSANAEMHGLARSLAAKHSFVIYPERGVTTPEPIVDLAQNINKQFELISAKLDNRLVRTYKNPVSKGTQADIAGILQSLKLNNLQHVFLMGIDIILYRNLFGKSP